MDKNEVLRGFSCFRIESSIYEEEMFNTTKITVSEV